MRHSAVLCVILALLVLSLSCVGGAFFVGTNGHDVSFFTVSGTVSVVQVVIVSGGQVTLVTLLSNGTAQDFQFCGDVGGRFPMNTAVTVRFQPGALCGNNVVVIVN